MNKFTNFDPKTQTYAVHIDGVAKFSSDDLKLLKELLGDFKSKFRDMKIEIRPVSKNSVYGALKETIRKVADGYRLVSKQGKNLGTYPTRAGAEKRERQVQYFKHLGEEQQEEEQLFEIAWLDENLHKWFKEKWVRFGPDGKIRGECARGSESEGKPKCLPQSKAHSLGKKARASAAARKRREDPDADRRGPAKNVATKKKAANEGLSEGSESAIQKIEKKIQAKRDALGLAREQRRMRGQHQQGQREIKIQAEIDRLSTELTQLKRQDVAEAGPFSYGYKKPRKGSVAYYADKKRKEQEKSKPPIEPKDQMVGVAKVTKAVSEGSDNNVYFEVDSENAYNHIMKKFRSVIDWDGDTMIAPRKYWEAIQELAYLAGGEASEVGGDQDLSEASDYEKTEKILKGITSKKAVKKQRQTDTKQQAKTAFDAMFGGGNPAANFGIRKNKDVSEGWLDDPNKKQDKKISKGWLDDPSPMTRDIMNKDKIRSLENLISIARTKGNKSKVQELETELKKMKSLAEGDDTWSVEYKGTNYECHDQDHAINKARKFLGYDREKNACIIKHNGKPVYTWRQGEKLQPVAEKNMDESREPRDFGRIEQERGMSFGGGYKPDAGMDDNSSVDWQEKQRQQEHDLKEKYIELLLIDYPDKEEKLRDLKLPEIIRVLNGEVKLDEAWSEKYKRSIDCDNPRGFSQRAHCAGKRKKTTNENRVMKLQCPDCGGPLFESSDETITEKKDACYYKVKSRYKVWPSAYASGALVKCRKKGAKNWGNKSKK